MTQPKRDAALAYLTASFPIGRWITRYHIVLFLILGLMLVGCKRSSPAEDTAYRTYYDSLQLDSPEKAILTFVRAYQKLDFHTVYLVLAPATQQELTLNPLDWAFENVIRNGLSPEDINAFGTVWGKLINIGDIEHNPDTRHLFTTMWAAAASAGILPFQFADEVVFLDAQSLEDVAEQDSLQVTIEGESAEEPIVFQMVLSAGQKWRVRQVLWPGGNEDDVPFSMKPNEERGFATSSAQVKIGLQPPRTGNIDLSTPHAAVSAFCRAFQQKDFPLVFWLLHARAQQTWWMDLALLDYERLVETDDLVSLLSSTDFGRNFARLKEAGVIDERDVLFVYLVIRGRANSPDVPLVMEHIGDGSYLFDQVMTAANARYLIDLTLPVTIVETSPVIVKDGKFTASVTTTLGDSPEEVTFHLRKSASGQWRILQVVVPNGDMDQFPWAVPVIRPSSGTDGN